MDKDKAMKVMAESHRETVEELEDRIYAISESYRQERDYNDELVEQNKRYREALEFYAEKDNYEWEITHNPQQEINCMVIDDGGEMANRSLEGES